MVSLVWPDESDLSGANSPRQVPVSPFVYQASATQPATKPPASVGATVDIQVSTAPIRPEEPLISLPQIEVPSLEQTSPMVWSQAGNSAGEIVYPQGFSVGTAPGAPSIAVAGSADPNHVTQTFAPGRSPFVTATGGAVTTGTSHVSGPIASSPVVISLPVGSAPPVIVGPPTVGGSNPVTVSAGAPLEAGTSQSVGLLTTGDEIWENGGTYQWKIADVSSAAPGSNWDAVSMTSLSISASSSNPFILKIVGLGSAGAGSAPANFDPDSQYQWVIAQVAGAGNVSINGVAQTASDVTLANSNDPSGDQFTLDTSSFATTGSDAPAAGSSFQLDLLNSDTDSELVLSYNPAPEPTTGLMCLAACAPALLCRRKR